MKPSHFAKNFVISYQAFFRLFFRTFFKSKNTQARLTVKRFFVMSGFFIVLFISQTLHWIGLLFDEIFFRGYRSVKVKAPLFIVGVPRSGTTFLHRLLARDTERFTTFSLWELILAPSVCERKLWLGLGMIDQMLGSPFKRLLRWMERHIFSGLDNIHQVSLSDEEEDYFLLLPIYACFLLILPFPFQDELGDLAFFDDRICESDKDRIMSFYKSCLKRHLYVKGTDRVFLSKNVAFTPMINELKKTFPDSRIIATVRNPINAVASHVSSMMTGAAVFDNDTRGNEFRDQMIEVQRYAYTHILETLPYFSQNSSMIVCMEDLQNNLASTIKDLYDRLGFQMTATFEAYIQAQDDRQKNYKSSHRYDLAKYGLSEEALYEKFSDVFEKLGYPRPGGKKGHGLQQETCTTEKQS